MLWDIYTLLNNMIPLPTDALSFVRYTVASLSMLIKTR